MPPNATTPASSGTIRIDTTAASVASRSTGRSTGRSSTATTTDPNTNNEHPLPPLPTFDSCVATDAPEQRTFGDGPAIPFVLSPPSPPTEDGDDEQQQQQQQNNGTALAAAAFVRRNRSAIDRALGERGAVLFRGFLPLATPGDFDAFVRAFEGFGDLSYERSMSFAVRTKLADRICTTNEGKSGGLVFHHEQAQTPLWPSHVFFCCQLPARPGDGGETGIVSSPVVYRELRERHPAVCAKLEEQGVRYTVFAGPDQDPSRGAGRSWKSFFHASTKEECEAKLRAGGWDWEWGVGPSGVSLGKDFLRCTTPVLEAVKVAPGHGEQGQPPQKCFFNQLIATTANALEFGRVGERDSDDRNGGGGYDPLVDVPTQEGIDECVRFGNGDPIPLDVLLEARDICEDLAVNVVWQKGDVLLLSNYTMMHARRPWKGPEGTRKLLASLVREDNCTSFGKKLVAA